MSKRMNLIIIIIEIIVLLGLSGYRVYEYINKDSNVNENNETVKKYKVTFDYGNNTVRSIEVEENEKIEFPDEPIKEGYIFDGWLLNSVVIDENYEVKEDITLKANWINENINSEIKILVYEINIRQEADVNSTDLGDVYENQEYDVLDIVETDTYTWYKIKKDNIVGYVANQKGESWVECGETEKDDASNEFLYFYEKDNEIISLNSNYAFFEETKNEYDSNYKLISEYSCDNCYMGEEPGDCSISGKYPKNNKYVIIFDYTQEFKYILYDVYSENIIDTYNDLLFINESYVIAEKNNKYKIINLKDNVSSDYYEDIANAYSILQSEIATSRSCYLHFILGDYDIDNQIITYKDNEKYGLLSLKDGNEITDAKYEEISIYQDNIVVKNNDYQYVLDEKGNIISKGYNKILYSNDKIIIIEENNLIDIIDYKGNSKINSKINAYGFDYSRTPVYTDVSGPRIVISTDNNNLKIEIPNPNEGYISIVYMYDMNNETLTIK